MELDRADDTDILLIQAREFVADSRYSDANSILREIVASHANKAAAYALMIKIEQDLNNVQGAISLAQEALQRFPTNNYILLDLGWLYFTAGTDSRAAECATTLIGSPVLSLSLSGMRLLIFIRARSKDWNDAGVLFDKLEDQDAVFCSSVAQEAAPTFEGIMVKMLADGNIPFAYKLLENLPRQVAPELTRIIEHLDLQPSKLPERRARFHPPHLLRSFCHLGRKSPLISHLMDFSRSHLLHDAGPRPKISVITPVLNGEKTIRSTIESVLQQDGVDLEYIIIDGGSTDATLSIISEYSDRVNLILSEKDKGLYDAVGKGFDLASGDVFCYLNASDTFEKAALARVVLAFLKNPGYEVIYFDETLDYGVWKTQNKRQPEVGFQALWRGHILFQASVFFTKRAYSFAGGINRSLKLAGDSELWLRLSYRFDFLYCRGHVSTSSVHEGQLSSDMVAYYGELVKIRQSFSEVLTSADWLRVGLQQALKSSKRVLSHLSASELRYNRLIFPLMSTDFNSSRIRETLPDKDICPVLRIPSFMFVASILCDDQESSRVNRAVFHERSGLISVYPKFLLKPLEKDRSEGPRDDPQIRRPHDASSYRNVRLLMQPKRRSVLALRNLLLKGFNEGAEITGRTKRNVKSSLELHPRLSLRPRVRKFAIGGKVLICGRRDDGLFDESIARVPDDRMFEMVPVESADSHAHLSNMIVVSDTGERFSATAITHAFDTVIVQNAQIFMNYPGENLRSISNLLSPGGRIIAVLPNLNSFLFDLFGINWKRLYTSGPSLIHSKKSIELIADRAGMKVERLSSFTSAETVADHLLACDEISGLRSTLVKRICLTAQYIFDWRLRGDEFVVVMTPR